METEIKYRKAMLKKYLGSSPAWFDLRKQEILRDKIDINQWQINMNYLIEKFGTIASKEQKAFVEWLNDAYKSDEYFSSYEYFEKNTTLVLTNISDHHLMPILYSNQDRNWFLAAYPDVFEYFCPQPDWRAVDFDEEQQRVKELIDKLCDNHERFEEYMSKEKGNQTIYLIRMKNYFKYELNKSFSLSTS